MKEGSLIGVAGVTGGGFFQQGQLPASIFPAPAGRVNHGQVQPGAGETRLHDHRY